MQRLTKRLRLVTHIVQYISYASIVLRAVMTVVDVIRRYVFGMTFTGVIEYGQILLIFSMTAMGYALAERRFVVVNEFVDKFPKKLNLAIELFMGIVSFAYFMAVGVMLIGQIASSVKFREAFLLLGFPRWPCYLVLGISFVACGMSTIVYTYEKIVNFKDPSEKTLLDEAPELGSMSLTKDVVEKEGIE